MAQPLTATPSATTQITMRSISSSPLDHGQDDPAVRAPGPRPAGSTLWKSAAFGSSSPGRLDGGGPDRRGAARPSRRRDLEHLLDETADAGVTRFVWLRQFEPSGNSADANRLSVTASLTSGAPLMFRKALSHEIPPHRTTRLRRQGERYFADGAPRAPGTTAASRFSRSAQSSGRCFLADAVVETHDRLVGRTYREAARACESAARRRTSRSPRGALGIAELGRVLIGQRDTGASVESRKATPPTPAKDIQKFPNQLCTLFDFG